MNAREYWDAVGTDLCKSVVEDAGARWGYWKHLACGRKRPGVDLAKALETASKKAAISIRGKQCVMTAPELLGL